ncbi:hypothetical protein ACTOB_000257 [Actinoplanes oblitus]|uniref:Type VII secretion protein EccE n=1 Tax=Actinoplanes oblitus TaxID=3040509 RepID=A0ABY8WG43_9ACTN|nr:hypothetical protein [Actinoplanes oblitus]WIM96790.1 hypothetical protein ACTOB_000257 [Actinoplanes oblitus]
MTTDLTPPRRSADGPTRPARRTYQLGLHQVIATQTAAGLVLAGVVAGGFTLLAAIACAALTLALTWLRVRDRWAFAWMAAVLRLRARRRAAARLFAAHHPASTGPPPGAPLRTAATALGLTAPGTRVTSTDLPGGPAAVLTDARGLTMLLDLGDPATLLAEVRPDLPAPWELLPTDGRDRPPGRLQLLLTGVPAPTAAAGTGPVAGSYRMLTEGRVLGHARAVLAVHVSRAADWSDSELRRVLTSQVRKLAKRLTAQPLDRPEAARLFFDLSYADPAAPIHEEWTALRTGALSQVTFHGHAPGGAGLSAELLARLLLLPATATTVTLTADVPAQESPTPPSPARRRRTPPKRARSHASARRGQPPHDPFGLIEEPQVARTGPPHDSIGPAGRRHEPPELDRPPHSSAAGDRPPRDPLPVTLAVRLAAPDPATLDAATAALRELTARGQIRLHRRDGDHLPGLGTTLPLALAGPEPPPGRQWTSRGSPVTGAFGRLAVPTGWSGLAIGRTRQGHPVLVRVFRPVHTRILLVGSLRSAQLTAFRAMAIGARVLVRTHRPPDWTAFARGASVPGDAIGIVPFDHPAAPPPGSTLHPVLTVLDPAPPTDPSSIVGAAAPGQTSGAGPATGPAPGVTPVGSARPHRPGDPDPPKAPEAGTDRSDLGPSRPHDLAGPGQDSGGPHGGGPDEQGDQLDHQAQRRFEGGPWTATLTVRETIGPGDAGAISRADLLLVQPLREAEAELIGEVLDLGDTTRLLGRMRPGMLGVLSPPAVRWALLAPTPVEKVLFGGLDRPEDER